VLLLEVRDECLFVGRGQWPFSEQTQSKHKSVRRGKVNNPSRE
jgi:hypothetical protein